jgi:hypothetical protein
VKFEGTFSNGPALPPVTLADVARAAYETNVYMFRVKARYWFQDSGWRKWRELTEAQQEEALASFRKPPPILETEDDFMRVSFNGIRFPYGALTIKTRPAYVIAGLGAVEIAGAPYGNPPYRRCAACGAAKRTLARQRQPYCARCSC